MYRDGALKSIWQSDINLTGNTAFSGQLYDVAIAGAGITGLSCAIALQERGLRCIVLEAENAGFGTTGGTTAHLNTFFDTTYDKVIQDFGLPQARLLATCGKEAIAFIREQVTKYSIDCDFEDKTAYLFALNDKQERKLQDIAHAANEVGVPMQPCSTIPFPIPFVAAVTIPDQAQFHPVRYIQGLRDAFIRAGGSFVERCRVLDYDSKEDKLYITTCQDSVLARYLIYATHTPPGINLIHFRNVPWRSYALAAKLEDGAYPQALGYDLNDPYFYYRSQQIDGEWYLIAGGEDHKTGDQADTDKCLEKLEQHVRKHFPVTEISRAWSSQFFEPADGLPYIGRIPGGPDNVFVATGYNGNGMIFGTASARILSDLIVNGSSTYEELFNPRRIKPVAGFATFVSHNASVVASFIKDKLYVEHLEGLAELEPGDGRVVEFDGNTYALYKDDGGKIHALHNSCTHAKCSVHWNNAEKTWDCPCHGSRFGIKGNVLNAPAVNDLKQIPLHKKIDDGLIL